MTAIAPEFVLISLVIVFFGGTVKGLVGFGANVTGTVLLAQFLDPSTAVVFMILPALLSSFPLILTLNLNGLKECLCRFYPLIIAATVGAFLGTLFQNSVPAPALRIFLGFVVVGYVLLQQHRFKLPSFTDDGYLEHCFSDYNIVKVFMGLISGTVFGSSNVGIQTVVYLDRLDLSHSVFIGVMSMYFVNLSAARLMAALYNGMFPQGVLAISVVASLFGVFGVLAGMASRKLVSDRYVHLSVLLFLFVAGLRLVTSGVLTAL
ncbi:MAG: sulfite exporter TauE/SafE family protein [Halobacteria archaeon]